MKAIMPRMMPKKQANRDKIMNARVASQYAVNTHTKVRRSKAMLSSPACLQCMNNEVKVKLKV